MKKWSDHFHAGRENLNDDPRSGQANTVIMADLIDKVEDLVRSYCDVTFRMFAAKVDVIVGRVCESCVIGKCMLIRLRRSTLTSKRN